METKTETDKNNATTERTGSMTTQPRDLRSGIPPRYAPYPTTTHTPPVDEQS